MAASLFALALQQLYFPLWFKHVLVWLSLSVCLLAANSSINNKKRRYLLTTTAWCGVWLLSLSFISTGSIFSHLSLACLLVFCCGINDKESQFSSPMLLQLNSLILCLFYLCVVISASLLAASFAIVSGVLITYIAYKKIRSPLRQDLVSSKKYQI